MNAYPYETTDKREHLIMRRYLEFRKNCQVQLEFRKSIRGIATYSIKMIKAEDNEPRDSNILQTEILIKLIRQESYENKADYSK